MESDFGVETLTRILSCELGTRLPIPRSSADIHDHKTAYTTAVREILEAYACRTGYECVHEQAVTYGSRLGRYDQVWKRLDKIAVAVECEWYYAIEEQLRDFEKLVYTRCPVKILIHRNRNHRVIPSLQERITAYPDHPREEVYMIIGAHRELEASTLRYQPPSLLRQDHGSFPWAEHGRIWADRQRTTLRNVQQQAPSHKSRKHDSDIELAEILEIAADYDKFELVNALRALGRFWYERPKSSFGGAIRYGVTEVAQVLLFGERGDAPPGQIEVRLVLDRVHASTQVPIGTIRDTIHQGYIVVAEEEKHTRTNGSRREHYMTIGLSRQAECDQLTRQIARWHQQRMEEQ